MVLQVVGVPFQFVLPLGYGSGKPACMELALEPFHIKLVGFHMFKRKDHIQFPAAFVT